MYRSRRLLGNVTAAIAETRMTVTTSATLCAGRHRKNTATTSPINVSRPAREPLRKKAANIGIAARTEITPINFGFLELRATSHQYGRVINKTSAYSFGSA